MLSNKDNTTQAKLNEFSSNSDRMQCKRRSARAWLFYDMGSSAYALSVGTLFFPLFFNEYAAIGKASHEHWAIAVLLSTIIIGITAPILGAYADQRLKRNIVFMITGGVSVIGTIFLPLTSIMSIWAAILYFVLVHATFNLATNIYDSYISLYGAQDKNYTRRSGLGWALGYLGGLIYLGVTLWSLGFRIPRSQNDYWVVFLIAAAMYGGFSAYVFFRLPEEGELSTIPRGTLTTVFNTVFRWKENRLFFYYIAGSILVVDGMTTVLYFMSIYSREKLNFSVGQITLVFAILQVVAIPSTRLLTMAVRYIKEVYLIVITCLCWMVLSAFFAAGPGYNGLLLLAVGGGLVVGTTPALLRAMLGHIVHSENRAELFGFASLASRVGAVLGPLIYLIVLKYFSTTLAMFSCVPAFLLGSSIFLALANKLPSDRLAKR